MQKRLRGSKRAILRKVTAVNLFADQATQIQAIMEATGAQEVAPVVRLLLDEALGARRRRSVHSAEPEPVPPPQQGDLETIQTLLLKMIRQGESTFQMQSVSLELLQETVVEARGGRMSLLEFVARPTLTDKGKSADEISRLFDAQNEDAKDYAYGLGEEIKKALDAAEPVSQVSAVDDDDR